MFSRFIIGREKPGEQSEVAQLIQQTLEQERWQREMMEQRYKQYMDDDEEVNANARASALFHEKMGKLLCSIIALSGNLITHMSSNELLFFSDEYLLSA